MDVAAWGVVEFDPGAAGADWRDEWLDAQQERLEWESKILDGVMFETHEKFEQEAIDALSDRQNEGWICWRELDVDHHTPESLQCLWGVTEAANFTPVSDGRGIPTQLSPYGQAYYDSWAASNPATDCRYHDCFGETHLYYDELEQVDWTGMATTRRVFACRRDGTTFYPIDDLTGEVELDDDEHRRLRRGEVIAWNDLAEWTEEIDGDIWLKYGRLSRHEAINSDWFGVFGEMERLADVHGRDSVRLVVWFDR